MLTNVGRRSMEKSGKLVDMDQSSLNGFERNALLENDGHGGFDDVAYHRGVSLVQDGRSIVAFDMDLDGDIDLYVANYRRRGSLLRNDTTGRNWLQVKLVGSRSNRDAVGARLTLTAGGVNQIRDVRAGEGFVSGSTLVQHFGLADTPRADLLTIRWPSGVVQSIEDPPVNHRIRINEDSEGYEIIR